VWKRNSKGKVHRENKQKNIYKRRRGKILSKKLASSAGQREGMGTRVPGHAFLA
jgi:hypothetical protein